MVRKVVVKLGGSFLLSDGQPNVASMKEMALSVKSLVDSGVEVVCVVGGGLTARQYIGAAQALGASLGTCDFLGILVSRLNARLFIEALGDYAWPEPAENLQQLRSFVTSCRPFTNSSSSSSNPKVGRVVVVGGLQPGQSTTAVAALCCEYLSYDLVLYCTNIPAVYTDDPRKNPDAKRLENVTYKDLQFLCGVDNSCPGQYQIMDQMALTILERSKLTAIILQGTAENLLAAIDGKTIGTKVGPL